MGEVWGQGEVEGYWVLTDLYHDAIVHGEVKTFFDDLNEEAKKIIEKAERIGPPVFEEDTKIIPTERRGWEGW